MSRDSIGVREQSSRFSETTRTTNNVIRVENAKTRWIAAVSAAKEIFNHKEHIEHKEHKKTLKLRELCELCVRLFSDAHYRLSLIGKFNWFMIIPVFWFAVGELRNSVR